MAATLTNRSVNSVATGDITTAAYTSNSLTWAEATFTWASAGGTWENPYGITNRSVTSATPTNVSLS